MTVGRDLLPLRCVPKASPNCPPWATNREGRRFSPNRERGGPDHIPSGRGRLFLAIAQVILVVETDGTTAALVTICIRLTSLPLTRN
jgi:hypothetical protein